MMDKISIIVPCFNEEACVNLYYDEMEKIHKDFDVLFEYIFVDDGSKDNTLKLIKELQAKNKDVHYISFSRNFGKEAAIYAGLKEATGNLVSLMDVDLQDPPYLLKEMYKGIQEGYDCVACRRTTRKGEPIIRSLFCKIFYGVINKMSKAEILNGARDFRLMTRPMVDAILQMAEHDRFSKGIFGWVGFKIKWLDYKNVDRVAGKTKWKFTSLFKYAVGGLEDFSVVPLKFNWFLTFLAFLSSLYFSISWIVYELINKPYHILYPIASVVSIGVLIVMFSLSVMSDYLIKIYNEAKNRPIYIVKEKN